MPSRLADVGQFPRVALDMEPKLRNLRSHAGTGVSGYRKEYFRAFVTDFADMRARTVLPLLNAFASAYANADLPAWFYTVFAAVTASLPIKSPAPVPDAAPDVRPVGVGECLRRAIRTLGIGGATQRPTPPTPVAPTGRDRRPQRNERPGVRSAPDARDPP